MRLESFMTGVDIAFVDVFVIVASGTLEGVEGRAGALKLLVRVGRGAVKAGEVGRLDRGGLKEGDAGRCGAAIPGLDGVGSSLNSARANAMLSALGACAAVPEPVWNPVEKPDVGGGVGPAEESALAKRASARARASDGGGGAVDPLPSWNPDVACCLAGVLSSPKRASARARASADGGGTIDPLPSWNPDAPGFAGDSSSPKYASALARAASDCAGASRPLAIANPLCTKGLSGGGLANTGPLEEDSPTGVDAGGPAGESFRRRLAGASSNSASRSASRTIFIARDMAASDGLAS